MKVITLNRAGEEVVLEAEGYLARCIQHEIDHLNGILYIDYVNVLYDASTGKRLKPEAANPILAHKRPLIRY